MSELTLTSIFDSHKEQLGEQLKKYSLPKDSKEVVATVANFLDEMFENDGEYRQSLTQSEDYILQAAIELMQTQQNITLEMVRNAASYKIDRQSSKVREEKEHNPYTSVGGAALGAAAGALFGPFGIVGGAIAGTAVAVYITTKSKKTTRPSETQNTPKINVSAFIDIIIKVCESIDNLIQTYRIQVKKMENALSNQEEVTLKNTYSILLDQIQNVINVAEQEEIPENLKMAISYMEKSLQNYDLEYKDGKIIKKN